LGAVLTLGRFALPLLQSLPYASKLTGAFGPIMDKVVKDPFTRNWLDMLCFLLSGLPASGTSAAEVAFMFAEWYRPEVVLDYPVGGSAALVEAMVRGLKKYGGDLRLGAHVEQVLVENNRAVGVRLRGGEEIRASKAVVSAASVWDTLKLIPLGALPQEFIKARSQTPDCESFMHLHLGIDGTGLPEDLACHYITVNDWEKGITSPLNLIVMSLPRTAWKTRYSCLHAGE
jgi:phytoene dehydrogenase-like protein